LYTFFVFTDDGKHRAKRNDESRNTDGKSEITSNFRIPRKQSHADVKHNSVLSDPRCERKRVNFDRNTSLKTVNCTPIAHAAGVNNHDSVTRTNAKLNWSTGTAAERVSERNQFHSVSASNISLNTGDKFSAAVPPQLARSSSDVCMTPLTPAVRTNQRQLQHSAVVTDGKDTVTQSERTQEMIPKTLPEELVRAGWKLCFSNRRSQWYVFNVRTGSSSWDVPK